MDCLTLSVAVNVGLLWALGRTLVKNQRAARCITALRGDVSQLCAERDRSAQLFLRGRGEVYYLRRCEPVGGGAHQREKDANS